MMRTSGILVGLLVLAGCAHVPEGVVAPPVDRVIAVPEAPVKRLDSVGLTHLLRGLYYLKTERPSAAVAHLRMALLYAPSSAFVHEELSRAWASSGNLDKAREVLKMGLESAPEEPHLNWLAGDLALYERRHAEAVEKLRIAVQADDVLVGAGPALIDALAWQGQGRAASEEAERLMERKPGSADLALRIGEALEDHGQTDAAISAYRRARVQRPADRDAAFGEMRLLELSGRPAAAADALVPLFAFYPEELGLYVQMARLLARAGRGEAAAYREEALRLSEGDAYGLALVASGDILEGELQPGLELLRSAVARHPDGAGAWLYLAEVLLGHGDPRGCLQACSSAPAEIGRQMHVYRARCHATLGELQPAADALATAVLEGPSPREALRDAPRVLAQADSEAVGTGLLERLAERVAGAVPAEDLVVARAALADLFGQGERAVSLLESLPAQQKQTPEMQLKLADLEARYGDLTRAVEWLEALLRERPGDPIRLNALGYTLADAGARLDEAAVFLRRAYRLAPDEGFITDSLGWLMVRLGRHEQGLELLLRASRALPGDPEILRHLGDAYRALGREQEALEAYRRALAARPPPPQRKLLEGRIEKDPS